MLGDFDAARDSLKASLELPSGTTADEGMVVLHHGLVDANEGLRAALAGDGNIVMRCMADAEDHFVIALELLSGSSDRSTAIAARTQQGAARCWLGKFSEGLSDLNAAVTEAAHSGFRSREVHARLELGYHLVGAGREHEGLAILGPALMQAEELGDLRRPADSHERLSALYEARADYQLALYHHKRYVEVKTRLDGRLSTQRARLHEARAELQKLRTQTAALHAEDARPRTIAFAPRTAGAGRRTRPVSPIADASRRSSKTGAGAPARAHCASASSSPISTASSRSTTAVALTGDVVLRQLGNVIRGNLRDIDFAARLGGDEFALLLADSEGGARAPWSAHPDEAVRSSSVDAVGRSALHRDDQRRPVRIGGFRRFERAGASR